MNYDIKRRIRTAVAFFLVWLSVAGLKAQPLPAEPITTAVDIKGVRHRLKVELKEHAPWLYDDVIKKLTPEYPFYALQHRLQGVALIHVVVDPKTGSATNISVKRSSGFRQLDDTAVAALRHWRWKREKWREMDIPFRFVIPPPPSNLATEG